MLLVQNLLHQSSRHRFELNHSQGDAGVFRGAQKDKIDNASQIQVQGTEQIRMNEREKGNSVGVTQFIFSCVRFLTWQLLRTPFQFQSPPHQFLKYQKCS